MSNKKERRNVVLSAALGVAIGVGLEAVSKQIEKVDIDDMPAMKMYDPNILESQEEPSISLMQQKNEDTLEERLNDLEKTREIKKIIEQIYTEQPFKENSGGNLLDRYYSLKWYLDRRIGNEFFLGELKSDIDGNGVRRVYFEVNVKKPDGEAGEDIKIEYEDDGSISVQDEGMVPYINIPPDSNMADSVIDQVYKVIRMREELEKYTTSGMEYPTRHYKAYLRKEGYSDEQIEYILKVKYKKPEDVIREMDNKP